MVVWRKSPSELRLHAQEREVVRCDNEKTDALRPGAAGQIIVIVPRRRNILENPRMLQVLPFWLRHSDSAGADSREIVFDPNELIRLRIGRGTQQSRLHQTENCRGGANAERHG